MTGLPEAARQALEALRDAADAIAGQLGNPATAMHNALIAESALRAALAAGPTPGPWSLETVRTDCGVCHKIGPFPGRRERDQPRHACLYADYPSAGNPNDVELHANAKLIAACNPAALAELLAELDGERNRSQMFADLVRGVAVVLHGEGWSDTSKLPEEVAALKAERKPLTSGDRLWLWRDGDRYLAFRHEFPCYSPGGDPMTLGDPAPVVVEFRDSHDRGINGD